MESESVRARARVRTNGQTHGSETHILGIHNIIYEMCMIMYVYLYRYT